MFNFIFESKERSARDETEVHALRLRYGNKLEAILSQRADDETLDSRDRKHWKRILRKAKA